MPQELMLKNKHQGKDNIVVIKDLRTSLNGKLVHKGIDLEVRTGETMIVLGASGSGKSVLFKSIVGLITPDSGSIVINGVDIMLISSSKELADFRRDIGVLFQGGSLFDSLNVYANVAFTLDKKKLSSKEVDDIVHEKLALVGLSPSMGRYMVSELSMGVQKRVALARAIAMSPKIMLYDEPTTGLDPLVAGIIDELILHLQSELKFTSLVVTHDLKSAFNIGDRVAFLHDGIIATCGSTDSIKGTSNPHLKEFISAM